MAEGADPTTTPTPTPPLNRVTRPRRRRRRAGEPVREADLLSEERPDKLPRIRVRAVGQAVNALRQSLDDNLQDLYDPERVLRGFYKPAEQYRYLQFAPLRDRQGQWRDPGGEHRIIVPMMEHTAKGAWRLKWEDKRFRRAQDLHAYTQTSEYQRARFFEATGDWRPRVSQADYRRFVERDAVEAYDFAYRTQLREVANGALAVQERFERDNKPLPAGTRRLTEADFFDFDTSSQSGLSPTSAIDRDYYVPIMGGPYYRQQYLYAHWEQTAKAFEMRHHSELAKAAINILSDFTLGRGVAWKIENHAVADVWQEFWDRNGMEDYVRTISDDYCLEGSTTIACLDGTNPTIAELAERHISEDQPLWVYSYDHATGRVVPGKAVRCWKQPKPKRCVTVTLDNGEKVTASHDHPFLMRNGEYVWAEDLLPGDSLMPLYRKLKNERYEQVWHPDAQGQRWQVTHHAVLGLRDREFAGTGLAVHHRDENRRDNRPSNLEIKPKPTHAGDHARERWADPEMRARMQESFTRSRSTESGRERQRRNARQLWTDEERKAQVVANIRDAYQTPEVQARHSEGVSRSWQDPDVRARRSAGIRRAAAERRLRRTRQPNNHKVVSVEPAGEQWVYDMSVAEFHNFALADAGVFVSNTWQGELLIRIFERPKGFLCIRSMDPGSFHEIITDPQDIRTVLYYAQSMPTQYQMVNWDFRGQKLNIPTSEYVIQQYPPSEIFHLKNNVSATEKWGRSDFFTALTTLKRHRDWTNAATMKDMLQANLVWKIKIQGDQQDVEAFIGDTNNATLPAVGGTWVENEALTLEPIHADVAGGGQRGAQGSTGNFLTALFATSQNMPVSYFNVSPGGTARATALTQGEPFIKKIATRQQDIRRLLDHLYEQVMKRAVETGRLAQDAIRHEDADPEWIFPAPFEEDRGAKFRDLKIARENAAISHKTMSITMAQDLGYDEYNYDDEQERISEERTSDVLGLWPDDTEQAVQLGPSPAGQAAQQQAMGVPPGMDPMQAAALQAGAPLPSPAGSDQPGEPAPPIPGGAPAQKGPSGLPPVKPAGRNEDLKGADERASFKKQWAGHEAAAPVLDREDAAFLEAALPHLTKGQAVVLPSGRVARVRG